MKVQGPNGARVRCDSCSRLEDYDLLTKDHRPMSSEYDRFFDFVVPPNGNDVDRLTGKVKPGKFRGIASESDTKKLAQLNACPGCAKRVRAAFKQKNPRLLPYGPLRTLMEHIEKKYGLRTLGMS